MPTFYLTTFYLATCDECGHTLPVPFYDKGDRDRWAAGHEEATGHEVAVREEIR